MWQTCRSSLIANSQVRKPTSFRFAPSNSAIRVFKSSKRPGLTASSITQYTFSFIKELSQKHCSLAGNSYKSNANCTACKIAQEAAGNAITFSSSWNGHFLFGQRSEADELTTACKSD